MHLKVIMFQLKVNKLVLINSDTDKIDLVIKVGQILDLTILSREDKEIIMNEENIEESLRPYFACNYMYTIDSFENIQ